MNPFIRNNDYNKWNLSVNYVAERPYYSDSAVLLDDIPT